MTRLSPVSSYLKICGDAQKLTSALDSDPEDDWLLALAAWSRKARAVQTATCAPDSATLASHQRKEQHHDH